jgi:hypothetical protein
MPGIKKLNLEKGMYDSKEELNGKTIKKSFSEVLEKEDPTENYKGTGLEKLDAFERQLLAHDIRTNGKNVASLAEFFKTSSSSVLFPEFVSRNIEIGMNKGKMEATVNDVVATTTNIDQADYRGITIDETLVKSEYRRVAEGAEFPRIRIQTKEKAIQLGKIGVRIESSYEALRRTKLNMIAIMFQVLGRDLASKIVAECIDVLVNGDGNANPAQLIPTATVGQLVFNDLVDLDMAFANFECDTLIGNKATISRILKLPQFVDGTIGEEYKRTGKFVTPLGNTLLVNKNIVGNLLVGFNKLAGVEQLIETGSSLVEESRLIDKQLNNSVISRVTGFSKIWSNSAIGLTF